MSKHCPEVDHLFCTFCLGSHKTEKCPSEQIAQDLLVNPYRVIFDLTIGRLGNQEESKNQRHLSKAEVIQARRNYKGIVL